MESAESVVTQVKFYNFTIRKLIFAFLAVALFWSVVMRHCIFKFTAVKTHIGSSQLSNSIIMVRCIIARGFNFCFWSILVPACIFRVLKILSISYPYQCDKAIVLLVLGVVLVMYAECFGRIQTTSIKRSIVSILLSHWRSGYVLNLVDPVNILAIWHIKHGNWRWKDPCCPIFISIVAYVWLAD